MGKLANERISRRFGLDILRLQSFDVMVRVDKTFFFVLFFSITLY